MSTPTGTNCDIYIHFDATNCEADTNVLICFKDTLCLHEI